MKIKIKLFANIRVLLGKSEIDLELQSGTDISTAIKNLSTNSQLLEEIKGTAMFSVNETYAEPNTCLKDGDVLAIIPPVSGG